MRLRNVPLAMATLIAVVGLAEGVAIAYGIHKSLDGWTKVEFTNPLQTN